MTDALASHYANALADAVFTPNSGVDPEDARRQLESAVALVESSRDLNKVLLSPAVPRPKKAEVVGRLLEEEGLSRLVRNFLMVVVQHRRVRELGRILVSFEAAIDARQGAVRADIISATELTGTQQQQLLHALGTKIGKYIRPVYKVDRSILGGVIARVGSREFDGSVTGRLEGMRRRLSTVS